MDRADHLKEAVDDVVSVADELRRLGEQVRAFGAASQRLRDVSEVIKGAAESVEKVPTALGTLLARAEEIEKRVGEAEAKLNAAIGTIPEVIARIQALDLTQVVATLSDGLTKVNAASANTHSLLEAMKHSFDERMGQQELFAQTLVHRLDEVTAAAKNNTIATEKVASGAASAGVSIASLKKQFEKAEIVLKDLRSRKGFLF